MYICIQQKEIRFPRNTMRKLWQEVTGFNKSYRLVRLLEEGAGHLRTEDTWAKRGRLKVRG